jgi:hypothetical protein
MWSLAEQLAIRWPQAGCTDAQVGKLYWLDWWKVSTCRHGLLCVHSGPQRGAADRHVVATSATAADSIAL